MSNPSPLIPQGTFQAQAAKGASNVRVAVATIVAIHIVFFGGLLLQGCKRDPSATAQTGTGDTNTNSVASLALPPLDNSLYYPSSNSLPTDAGTGVAAVGTPETNAYSAPGTLSNQGTLAPTPESLWQATNLTSPTGTGTALGAGDSLSGAMKDYTVVSGDSLSRIAVRNKTTVAALKQANPNVDPVRIRPGDKLKIPAAAASASSSGTSLLNGTGVGAAGTGPANTYTVKGGDTLTKIAKNHGVTVSQLRAANNMRTARVNVGQKLKIPARSQASNGATSPPPTSPQSF